MSEIYCIYTDKLTPEAECSIEHILPLSLGGCNEFVIKVNAAKNATLGSEIDGKLANDFILTLVRKGNNFKGHSKKDVVASLKKSSIENRSNNSPVQVSRRGAPSSIRFASGVRR